MFMFSRLFIFLPRGELGSESLLAGRVSRGDAGLPDGQDVDRGHADFPAGRGIDRGDGG